MIRFYTYPNPTTTATDAPFLGRIVPNGVVNRNDIVAEIKNRIATTDARVISHVEEAIAVAIEKAKLSYTIDFGFMKFVPRINGSVECVDTPWAADVQKFVLEGYGNADLRNCLDSIAPTRIDGGDLASKIRVDNIEDLDSKRIGVIVGTKQFVVVGNGMTVDSEGESVKLLNKKTLEVVQAATIVSVSKGQRAYCKFATAPEAGKYYLEVRTKGLVGLEEPIPFRKPVTVEVDPTPPAPTPTWDIENGHEFHNTVANEINGTNLDTARFKVMDIEEGDLHEVPDEYVTSRTATKVVLSGSFVSWAVSDVGVSDGTPFVLCKADGTEAARASCKYILDD